MKRSELIAKLDELFGAEDDVEIYLDTPDALTNSFNIFIDNDGDARIKA